jgi:hypothetical protein
MKSLPTGKVKADQTGSGSHDIATGHPNDSNRDGNQSQPQTRLKPKRRACRAQAARYGPAQAFEEEGTQPKAKSQG